MCVLKLYNQARKTNEINKTKRLIHCKISGYMLHSKLILTYWSACFFFQCCCCSLLYFLLLLLFYKISLRFSRQLLKFYTRILYAIHKGRILLTFKVDAYFPFVSSVICADLNLTITMTEVSSFMTKK